MMWSTQGLSPQTAFVSSNNIADDDEEEQEEDDDDAAHDECGVLFAKPQSFSNSTSQFP